MHDRPFLLAERSGPIVRDHARRIGVIGTEPKVPPRANNAEERDGAADQNGLSELERIEAMACNWVDRIEAKKATNSGLAASLLNASTMPGLVD